MYFKQLQLHWQFREVSLRKIYHYDLIISPGIFYGLHLHVHGTGWSAGEINNCSNGSMMIYFLLATAAAAQHCLKLQLSRCNFNKLGAKTKQI